MNILICSACRGSKIVAPLGSIEHKCSVCNGTGLNIDSCKTEVMPLLNELPPITKTRKSRKHTIKQIKENVLQL